jgi:putative ABC transport system permease protein
MLTLIKISWRNVWRNKTRSFVIILAIAFGLWGGIFSTSIFTALIQQQFDSSIKNQISHIQIHHPEFLKDRNTTQVISHSAQVEMFLENDPRVSAFAPRTLSSGMLASASMTSGVEIFGIDPVREHATREFENNIIEGEYLDTDLRNAILVGARLAEKMRLEPGNRVVITFQDSHGEITAAAFRVAGIYRTANTSLDERNVYIRRADMEKLMGQEGLTNEIAILLHDIEEVSPMMDLLQQEFPENTIRSWSEISPELSFMSEMSGMMMMILVGIILLALAFGLLNTMLMTIFERTRELGVLMSVGMNKARVFSMIIFETTFITLTGAAAGVLIGSATIWITSGTGIDFTSVGGDTLSDFGFDAVVYPTLETSFFGYLAVMVLVTALLSSIYPAWKALKLNPAEAVRKE